MSTRECLSTTRDCFRSPPYSRPFHNVTCKYLALSCGSFDGALSHARWKKALLVSFKLLIKLCTTTNWSLKAWCSKVVGTFISHWCWEGSGINLLGGRKDGHRCILSGGHHLTHKGSSVGRRYLAKKAVLWKVLNNSNFIISCQSLMVSFTSGYLKLWLTSLNFSQYLTFTSSHLLFLNDFCNKLYKDTKLF